MIFSEAVVAFGFAWRARMCVGTYVREEAEDSSGGFAGLRAGKCGSRPETECRYAGGNDRYGARPLSDNLTRMYGSSIAGKVKGKNWSSEHLEFLCKSITNPSFCISQHVFFCPPPPLSTPLCFRCCNWRVFHFADLRIAFCSAPLRDRETFIEYLTLLRRRKCPHNRWKCHEPSCWKIPKLVI